MSGLESGNLCRAYDSSGSDRGVCIYLQHHSQWSLSRELVKNPELWHAEVLMDGEVKYLNTNDWTLILLNNEEL